MSVEKNTPKGGKKGGAKFPRIPLSKAIEYSGKLVAKTHTGPQPRNIIGPGVFGTAGTAANERISALRQFGLLDGSDKGYQATDFARKLAAAPTEERKELLQRACLASKLFKNLYDTFAHDTVSKAKVKQQVLNFDVHPDFADTCVGIFLESASAAELCSLDGENANFNNSKGRIVGTEVNLEESPELANNDSTEIDEVDASAPGPEASNLKQEASSKGRANLEIKIDPSMDPEKLEKLLIVLKKFGQI